MVCILLFVLNRVIKLGNVFIDKNFFVLNRVRVSNPQWLTYTHIDLLVNTSMCTPSSPSSPSFPPPPPPRQTHTHWDEEQQIMQGNSPTDLEN